MRRSVKRRLPVLGNRLRLLVSPFVIGLGIWIVSPTTTGHQDMASLISGATGGQERWRAVMEKSVAGSVHNAEIPFAMDESRATTLSGAGFKLAGIGDVAVRNTKPVAGSSPDEDRINRKDKRGRLVKVAPVAPPKAFTAGVYERTSSLIDPEAGVDLQMAFASTKIRGKEVQIASTFFVKGEKEVDPAIPVMLASLVTNHEPDILATAYAPPKPDYARTSPFASLLKNEEQTSGGRFVPPVMADDHSWAKVPLPKHVFSAKEQQCLAAGIYFEARGEPVKGQVAVAQVILNRVRAPSYPGTICGVVYQNKHRRNRCQFSFACDRIRDRVSSPRHWQMAKDVGMAVTAGKIWLKEVGSSTHYHATYVNPRWAGTMKRMNKIGRHIFYRTFGGGWS